MTDDFMKNNKRNRKVSEVVLQIMFIFYLIKAKNLLVSAYELHAIH